MTTKVDPLLPVIVAGRPMHFNNLHRAKIIAGGLVPSRNITDDVLAGIVEQIEFAQAEALQRRTWEDKRALIAAQPAKQITS